MPSHKNRIKTITRPGEMEFERNRIHGVLEGATDTNGENNRP